MYEYKHISYPIRITLKSKKGENFQKAFSIIEAEAKNGWRFVQMISPTNEKSGLMPYCYELIFEKEI
jgi:hypothetical protein